MPTRHDDLLSIREMLDDAIGRTRTLDDRLYCVAQAVHSGLFCEVESIRSELGSIKELMRDSRGTTFRHENEIDSEPDANDNVYQGDEADLYSQTVKDLYEELLGNEAYLVATIRMYEDRLADPKMTSGMRRMTERIMNAHANWLEETRNDLRAIGKYV